MGPRRLNITHQGRPAGPVGIFVAPWIIKLGDATTTWPDLP